MRAEESPLPPRLRIGELANLAGTTTRAIRYYHSIGLLSEPERDDSGYRRYGTEDLVRLVRIRRLRSLDMPLEQIAQHLWGDPSEHGDLQATLRLLAEDIGRQIEELQALRQRVLDLAASTTLAAPADRWQAALRAHGLRGGTTTRLPAGEQAAADVLDALHPGGVEGVIAQSSALLSEPQLAARIEPLLRRFRALTDDDAAIDQLAGEFAALLPRPAQAAPPVDLEAMDKLLGDRFTSAQRHCLHRLRELVAERDR
jgi:DNA-binding transcriptional MerR regulator